MAGPGPFPLLASLFALLVIGASLRRARVLPDAAPDVLNRIIVDVTMPALILDVLAGARFSKAMLPALLATTAALLLALALATLAARAFRLPRPAQGSAGLTGAFANTGFLGVPFVVALYAGDGQAAATAIVVDTIDTTLLLWTLGVAFAVLMAGRDPDPQAPALGRRLAVGARALLVRPMILAVVAGVALAAAGVELPPALRDPLARVGGATSTLVFLSLGMTLDLSAVRGRALPLSAVALVKLVVAPASCFALVSLFGVTGVVAEVAVLQAAMPTALVSTIVAATFGCDRAFAAGVAVVTTLGALGTLPIWIALLRTLAP